MIPLTTTFVALRSEGRYENPSIGAVLASRSAAMVADLFSLSSRGFSLF